jgi:hypothetical protein
MIGLLSITITALLAQKGYALSLVQGCFKSSPLVDVTRRNLLSSPCLAFIPAAFWASPLVASASQSVKADMIAELQTSRDKLAPIPQLLEEKEWEKVRNILKTPPGENQFYINITLFFLRCGSPHNFNLSKQIMEPGRESKYTFQFG